MRIAILGLAYGACSAFAAGDWALLPAPKGRYATDIKILELIDHGRQDPYDPNGGPRKLMVSVIFPTMPAEECRDPDAFRYVPTRTAQALGPLLSLYGWPNATSYMEKLMLPVCPTRDADRTDPWSHKEIFPVVLFSHGLGSVRLLSGSQAQAVASNGFVVIAIDHPYDAAVVEYTDGSLVFACNFTNNDELDRSVNVRVQDAKFIIKELDRADSPLRVASVSSPDQRLKLGMFGHSLGGATSIRAKYDDERILGAIDMDGIGFGFNTSGSYTTPVFHLPRIRGPFVLFNEPAFLTNQPNAADFQQLYDSFTGWKHRLILKDAAHLSFTDLPLLIDAFGLRDRLPPSFEASTGTISGMKARDAIAAYVSAFMDRYLKGKRSDLLEAPGNVYSELVVVEES